VCLLRVLLMRIGHISRRLSYPLSSPIMS
jgi:hypothetical protein